MFFSWISDHRQFRPKGIEKAAHGFPASRLAMMTLFSFDHRLSTMDTSCLFMTRLQVPDAADFRPPSSFTLKSPISFFGATFFMSSSRGVHNGYGCHFLFPLLCKIIVRGLIGVAARVVFGVMSFMRHDKQNQRRSRNQNNAKQDISPVFRQSGCL